jgi:PASTA domain
VRTEQRRPADRGEEPIVRSGQVAAAGLAVAMLGIFLGVRVDQPTGVDRVPVAATQLPAYARPPASFEQLLSQSAAITVDRTDGHTLIARSPDASVSVPDRLSGRITLTGPDGTTGLRSVGGQLAGRTAANGVVVYRGAHPATDIAVHILEPTALRVFYVLTGTAAPQQFELAVDVPPGTSLSLVDGGVVMSRHGAVIGAVTPPWALDANGRVVPTRYRLARNTIVLSVEHRRAGTAYPVVADPPFFTGRLGSFLGSQLRAGILQWAIGQVAGWAASKARNNGCLSLRTFPSCVLHPFSYSWKNPAGPPPSRSPVTVPQVTGKRLPDAHDTLAAAGLTRIDYVDDTGQGRVVVQPTNWTVVAQSPLPGAKVAPDTRITLRVHKPSDGRRPSGGADGTVPDVVCMDLAAARAALRSAGFPSIGSVDGLGQRHQIIDRNWVVIAQSVPAGSRPTPTTRLVLTVVRYGEPTGSSGCAS